MHVDGTLNDPSDEDRAWSVEIAIPWKAFISNYRSNTPPKDGEQWKVNFSRVHWETDIINGDYVKKDAREFNWVWSPQGLIYMHMPEYWGLVQFSEVRSDKNAVSFNDTGIDKIKWALRQVYIKQRNYFFKNDRYTKSIGSLNLRKSPARGITWPPKIVLTPSGWEAVLNWNDQKVIIRKDGKVWTE